MLIFLNFETITLGVSFWLVSRLAPAYLARWFPLKGAVYLMPFNQVDEEKVPMGEERERGAQGNKKRRDKKKEEKTQLPQTDYNLGAVVAEFENMKKLEGASDYQFLGVMGLTSIVGILTKPLGKYLKPLFKSTPLPSNFFDDMSMEIYLLGFVIFSYMVFLHKNLHGLASMKPHKGHAFYMAFIGMLLCLFSSFGFESWLVPNLTSSINYFNVGAMGFLNGLSNATSGKKDVKVIHYTRTDFMSMKVLVGFLMLLIAVFVYYTAPAVIKFVDAFQINRKQTKINEEALENAKIDPEVAKSKKKLLSQYKRGTLFQFLSLVFLAVTLVMAVPKIRVRLFGNILPAGYAESVIPFLIFAFLGICVEAYSTRLQIVNRSHYLFEILVGYRPKNDTYKQLFVRRCFSIYQESIRNMLHSYSNSFLSLSLLLILISLLRKPSVSSLPSSDPSSIDNPSQLLTTPITQSLHSILTQSSHCPLSPSSTISSIHPSFALLTPPSLQSAHQPGGLSPSLLTSYTLPLLISLSYVLLVLCRGIALILTMGHLVITEGGGWAAQE